MNQLGRMARPARPPAEGGRDRPEARHAARRARRRGARQARPEGARRERTGDGRREARRGHGLAGGPRGRGGRDPGPGRQAARQGGRERPRSRAPSPSRRCSGSADRPPPPAGPARRTTTGSIPSENARSMHGHPADQDGPPPGDAVRPPRKRRPRSGALFRLRADQSRSRVGWVMCGFLGLFGAITGRLVCLAVDAGRARGHPPLRRRHASRPPGPTSSTATARCWRPT